TPAIDQGTVYVVSENPLAKLYAIDARDGAKLWSRKLSVDAYAGPAVSGGMVFVGTRSDLLGDLFAVDASTGDIRWTRPGPVPTVPAISRGRVYYTRNDDNTVRAVDATSGLDAWTTGLAGPAYSSVAVANGVLYVGSDDNKLYALDAATGEILWSWQTGGAVESSPAVSDGMVFV